MHVSRMYSDNKRLSNYLKIELKLICSSETNFKKISLLGLGWLSWLKSQIIKLPGKRIFRRSLDPSRSNYISNSVGHVAHTLLVALSISQRDPDNRTSSVLESPPLVPPLQLKQRVLDKIASLDQYAFAPRDQYHPNIFTISHLDNACSFYTTCIPLWSPRRSLHLKDARVTR